MWTAAGRAVTGSHLGTITVRGCRFEENDAEYYGAWSDQNTTFLTVEECVFVRNSSIVQGGAMSHAQTGGVDLDPVRFRRSVFTDNVCTEGGGGALRLGAADGELEACVFTSNRATSGGAILAGTQFTKRGAQDLILVNCLLQGNEATFGGGILGEDNPLFRLVNTTLIDNVATGFDVAGVFTEADVVDIDGSILHGNVGSSGGGEAAQLTATFPGGVSVDYTLLEGYSGLFPGTGNLDVDPAFVDRLGPDGVAGTGDEDLAPASGSPLIDAGNNAALPAGVVTDLAGAPRFQDDPGTADTGAGTPPVVDIGALEFAGVTVGVDDVASVPGRLRVYASPNPFRRNTRIHLDLDADRGAGTRTDALRVAVVDVRGRRIRSLDVASSRDAGLAQSGAIDWDGRDDKGRSVPAGVYWIEVEGAPRARVVHTP
jgi:predicted outer membrane repeat protein